MTKSILLAIRVFITLIVVSLCKIGLSGGDTSMLSASSVFGPLCGSLLAYFMADRFVWRDRQLAPAGTRVFSRVSTLVMGVSIAVLVLNSFVGYVDARLLRSMEEPRLAAMTPEQRSAEADARVQAAANKAKEDERLALVSADEKRLDDLRMDEVYRAKQMLRRSLRDPDSLKINAIGASRDAVAVCIDYSARNGFGGMNRELVVYVGGTPFSSEAVWREHCLRDVVAMNYMK